MIRIRVGFEISFRFSQPTAMLALLNLHPSRVPTRQMPQGFEVEPVTSMSEFVDSFGNRCSRLFVPAGSVTLRSNTTVEDCGKSTPQIWNAVQHSVQELPDEVLIFLLASRYCEVDSELADLAGKLFNSTPPGWHRVQSICNFVFQHLRFDYNQARANRTAVEAFHERTGVCRDYTHLAITLCRCMNIPARYCTGYLGDIGVAPSPDPMDFSAWFEVYLGGDWHTFDPRNNTPRIGYILIARGRDAADAALTTTFGVNELASFKVWADEIAG